MENTLKKVNKENYTQVARQIVEDGAEWVAFERKGELKAITAMGFPGYAYAATDEVIALKDLSWNDMNALAKLTDPTGGDMTKLPTPRFKVATPVKIGTFEEVHRRAYDITPLDAYIDYSNMPIVVRKSYIGEALENLLKGSDPTPVVDEEIAEPITTTQEPIQEPTQIEDVVNAESSNDE